jgi:CRISPR-associated protein Csh2
MPASEIRTGEILFVKCVKDGIPNRDPLRDSDARRIFGEADGRISLSDVSIKRDVRDYVLARYPDGKYSDNDQPTMGVFVRKEYKNDKILLGRGGLAKTMWEKAKIDPKTAGKAQLMEVAFDARVFGVVFSVGKKAFNQCGPVQFGWAHSLHPVDTKYVHGTVVMPSTETTVEDDVAGKTQGTIWTGYTLPFAVFAMPAVVNASIAGDTGMSDADLELLLEGIWKGTIHRQARGRGIQQPLMMLHVEYNDPFFRLGFLEEDIKLIPARQEWLGDKPPASLSEITLDVTKLAQRLESQKDKIHRVRVLSEPRLQMNGAIQAEIGKWS